MTRFVRVDCCALLLHVLFIADAGGGLPHGFCWPFLRLYKRVHDASRIRWATRTREAPGGNSGLLGVDGAPECVTRERCAALLSVISKGFLSRSSQTPERFPGITQLISGPGSAFRTTTLAFHPVIRSAWMISCESSYCAVCPSPGFVVTTLSCHYFTFCNTQISSCHRPTTKRFCIFLSQPCFFVQHRIQTVNSNPHPATPAKFLGPGPDPNTLNFSGGSCSGEKGGKKTKQQQDSRSGNCTTPKKEESSRYQWPGYEILSGPPTSEPDPISTAAYPSRSTASWRMLREAMRRRRTSPPRPWTTAG